MKKLGLIAFLITLFSIFLVSCSQFGNKKPSQLGKPEISLENDIVSWQAVDHAEAYDVYVNNSLKTTVTSTSYKITETAVGEYKINVVANSTEELWLASEKSNGVTYKITGALGTPIVTLNGKTASWQAVANATSYEVFVNGVSKGSQTDLSYSLAETTVGSYEIQVVAKSSNDLYIESEKSTKVTVVIEKTPLTVPTLTLNGNVVSWTAVANASKYEVFVNGTSKGQITATSYTINATTLGDYIVKVLAVSGDDQHEDSAQSNSVTYTLVATKLAAPQISIFGRIISWPEVANATGYEVFVNGVSIGTQAGLSYELTQTDIGIYEVEVKSNSTSELYSESDKSNKVSFDVSATPLSAPVATIEGNVVSWQAVDNATEYDVYVNGTKVSSQKTLSYTVKAYQVATFSVTVVATTTNSNYLASVASNAVNYKFAIDLTKPVLLSVKDRAGKVLTFKDGSQYTGATLANLESFLAVGDDIDLANLSSFYGDAVQFIPASFNQDVVNGKNGQQITNGNNFYINPEDGAFFYIKTADGKYLAFTNGDSVGKGGTCFTTKGVLMEENNAFLWQLIETPVEGEYLIRNVAASMIYANAYNNGINSLCVDSDNHLWQFPLIGNATDGYHYGFIFSFTQVEDAPMSADKRIELEGNKTIYAAWTNTFLKYAGNMVDGGASVGEGCYVFTFEKVANNTYKDTYRIKVGSKYLTYVSQGVMELSDLDESDNGQIFVLQDAPGLKNGYLISNIKMGYFGDWFVGLDRLVVFKYEALNSWGERQNIYEWSYHNGATFFIASTDAEVQEYVSPFGHTCDHVCPECGKCTDESCTDPACADKCQRHSIFDNPVLISVKEAADSALEFVNGTGSLDSYLAVGSTIDKNNLSALYGSALQFIPAEFKETATGKNAQQIAEGNAAWINANAGKFYFIKTTDGKYLSGLNGDQVGMGGKWFVTKGALDAENYMYMWQVIETATEGEYLLRNVGMSMIAANAWNVNTYICRDTDGHIHQYSLIENHNAFIFTFTQVKDATFAEDAEVELAGENTIKNLCTNTYLKYDTNMADAGSNLVDAGVFEFVKVTLGNFTNAYRIKVGSKYLTYVSEGVMELSDLDEADNGQIFILEKLAGIKNGYRIANVKMGYFWDWFYGLDRLVVFNYEAANAWRQRQNILEWDYYTGATFIIETVVAE